ncbi:MAG: ribose-5-phosphate isomerase RpiA [Acidimicrobiales bacterium]
MRAPDAGEVAETKRVAAEWAAELVEAGMVVGLGTGSTAVFALRRIAERLAEGSLTDVRGIPTSEGAAATAAALGLPVTSLEEHPVIDLTIDGADEVDPALNLIKGGGGALLREKIVAQASRREIIVVDSSKCSPLLGTHHSLPVEVVEFGWRPEVLHLESLGAKLIRRTAEDGSPFRTGQENFILDCDFAAIDDPAGLELRLIARAGVVAVGLFCGLATDLVIGGRDGVEHRTRRP